MIISVLFLGSACTGMQVANIPDVYSPKPLKDFDPPKWVMKGGGAYSDDKGKAFYGVGSATGIKNYSLQRTVADDRARGDLAKIFSFYVASLTKDYQGNTTAGDFLSSTEEQNVEVALKVIVSQSLSGVVIVDHFEVPERMEMLSLARLDFDMFENNIKRNKTFRSLPKELRDNIRERAEDLHEELQQETDSFTVHEDKDFF